jgi:hypothetical protein
MSLQGSESDSKRKGPWNFVMIIFAYALWVVVLVAAIILAVDYGIPDWLVGIIASLS